MFSPSSLALPQCHSAYGSDREIVSNHQSAAGGDKLPRFLIRTRPKPVFPEALRYPVSGIGPVVRERNRKREKERESVIIEKSVKERDVLEAR